MVLGSASADLLLALVTVWENQRNVAFGFRIKPREHRFARKSSARPVFILSHAARLWERACPFKPTSTLRRSTTQAPATPRLTSTPKARHLTTERTGEEVLFQGQISIALAARSFASRPLELRSPRICPAAKFRPTGLDGIHKWKSHGYYRRRLNKQSGGYSREVDGASPCDDFHLDSDGCRGPLRVHASCPRKLHCGSES
jgi:hypothetical protein